MRTKFDFIKVNYYGIVEVGDYSQMIDKIPNSVDPVICVDV